MNDKRLFLTGIILVFLLSGLLVIDASNQPTLNMKDAVDSAVGKLTPTLTVKVFNADGTLISQVVKNDDLITVQFKQLLQMMLSNTVTQLSMKDSSGTLRSVYGRSDTAVRSYGAVTTGSGGFIAIGTSSTAASINDYKLGGEITSSVLPTEPGYVSGVISFTSTFTMTASYNLNEAGVYLKLRGHSGLSLTPNMHNFLVFRDTFTTQAVVSGNTVSVTYSVNLNNTGFTQNFGHILREVMRYTTAIDHSTDVVDVDGSTRHLNLWHAAASLCNNNIQCTSFGTQTSRAYITLGGSNTSLALTDYNLMLDISAFMINGGESVSTVAASQTNNITISAPITFSGSTTVREAGFFMTLMSDNGTMYDIMLFRILTGATAVTAGTTKVPAFKVEM